MGWTKREIVVQAFDKSAVGGLGYDPTPEDLQTGLRELDLIMAEWAGKGLRVGYPLPNSQAESDISVDSGLPDLARSAAVHLLAEALCINYGKTPHPDLARKAREAKQAVSTWALRSIPKMKRAPGTPMGSGNSASPYRNYFPEQGEPVLADGGNDVMGLET